MASFRTENNLCPTTTEQSIKYFTSDICCIYCCTFRLFVNPTNQNTYFELLKYFYTFLQIFRFYEFLHISTNFYEFLRISTKFTNFYKLLQSITKFYIFKATEFLQISTNFYDHSYTFLLFSRNTNVKTCLHAVLSHHRLNSLQIF